MHNKPDYIEELIRDNRDFFTPSTLPEGHTKRFEQRLKKQRRPVLKPIIPWLTAAAAAIVLIAVLLPQVRPQKGSVKQGVLTQVSDQYGEVEYYFTSSIHKSIGQLESLLAEGYGTSTDSLMIQEELRELEERHLQLQEDLKLAPDDERIVNAMIEVYRRKMDLINAILMELQEVKQRKNQTNETTNL